MTAAAARSRMPRIQSLIESRPPSQTWSRPSPMQSNQPSLNLIDHEPDNAGPAAPNGQGVRVSLVKARWAARPRAGLPDVTEWSSTLGLAMIQALLGQRPASQLNRWVVEDVLAAISIFQRRSLRTNGQIAESIALRSIHIQLPEPEIAEVAAHVIVGKRSIAMAFRLEALSDRWLCTALELGARWSRVSGSA